MVRVPASEVDEVLKKQQEDFDEPDDAELGKDVGEDLARVIGNEPDEDAPFSIAEEVDSDTDSLTNDKPEDSTEDDIEEIESEMEKIEKEKHKEDTSDE